MLNAYRDEAEQFMCRLGDFQKDGEQKLEWLGEEYGLLCAAESRGDGEKTDHEIYDMLFLLFEMAADRGVDLDALWDEGRRRKAEKYPAETPAEGVGVELRERTEEHVREYFRRTQDPSIRAMLPMTAETEEQAVEQFRRSICPGAKSCGRTIYADGRYVGDVWIYCIHEEDEPDAMLSCCVFDKSAWGRGVAAAAVRQFLPDMAARYDLHTVGAFTYAKNAGSLRVLQKTGFAVEGRFTEDGVDSCYCLKRLKK